MAAVRFSVTPALSQDPPHAEAVMVTRHTHFLVTALGLALLDKLLRSSILIHSKMDLSAMPDYFKCPRHSGSGCPLC